jgi:hypothetical protein
MKYILSYINFVDGDLQLDREFSKMEFLVAWVNTNYPNFTSYQVICLKAD